MALNSLSTAIVVNRGSFKEMPAEEVIFTQSHQPRHVKFVDTAQGGLTSTPQRSQEDVALPSRSILQSHPEETWL